MDASLLKKSKSKNKIDLDNNIRGNKNNLNSYTVPISTDSYKNSNNNNNFVSALTKSEKKYTMLLTSPSSQQSTTEKIKSYLRVRPLLSLEKEQYNEIKHLIINNSITIEQEEETKKFIFDYCFSTKSTQEEIFNITTKATIESVIQGFNATIFCYGQTGSGKTHTMVGDVESSENKGIVFRSLEYLFFLRNEIYRENGINIDSDYISHGYCEDKGAINIEEEKERESIGDFINRNSERSNYMNMNNNNNFNKVNIDGCDSPNNFENYEENIKKTKNQSNLKDLILKNPTITSNNSNFNNKNMDIKSLYTEDSDTESNYPNRKVFNNTNNNIDQMSITFQASFFQIYMETLQDLLEPSNTNLKLREDLNKQVYLENATWKTITNISDAKMIFKQGEKNRTTAKTLMNSTSSRSHAIFIIKTSTYYKGVSKISQLYLVDLAGSERVTKTGVDSIRLEEAKKINFSLLALGNCIQALACNNNNNSSFSSNNGNLVHVAYRDSKLTRLLKDSLGGNSKTSLIVTISLSDYNYDESVSSMLFGQRAMKITNKINQNEVIADYKEMYFNLLKEFEDYKSNNNINTFNNSNNKERISLKYDNTNNNKNNHKSTNEDIELENFYSELIKQKDSELELVSQKLKQQEEKITAFEQLENSMKMDLTNLSNNNKVMQSTNTDNLSYTETSISILNELYNTSNKNWYLKHFEEALNCLNEDNLTLLDEVNSLKSDLSNKNFECLRLKEINKQNKELIAKIEKEVQEKEDNNKLLQVELNSFLENGVNYKKMSYDLKRIFNESDYEINSFSFRESFINEWLDSIDKNIKECFNYSCNKDTKDCSKALVGDDRNNVKVDIDVDKDLTKDTNTGAITNDLKENKEIVDNRFSFNVFSNIPTNNLNDKINSSIKNKKSNKNDDNNISKEESTTTFEKLLKNISFSKSNSTDDRSNKELQELDMSKIDYIKLNKLITTNKTISSLLSNDICLNSSKDIIKMQINNKVKNHMNIINSKILSNNNGNGDIENSLFAFPNYSYLEQRYANSTNNNTGDTDKLGKLKNPISSTLASINLKQDQTITSFFKIISLLIKVLVHQNNYTNNIINICEYVNNSNKYIKDISAIIENENKSLLSIINLLLMSYISIHEVINNKNSNRNRNDSNNDSLLITKIFSVFNEINNRISRLSINDNNIKSSSNANKIENLYRITSSLYTFTKKQIDNFYEEIKKELEENNEQMIYYIREINILKTNKNTANINTNINSNTYTKTSGNIGNINDLEISSLLSLKEEENMKLKKKIQKLDCENLDLNIKMKGMLLDSMNKTDKKDDNKSAELANEGSNLQNINLNINNNSINNINDIIIKLNNDIKERIKENEIIRSNLSKEIFISNTNLNNSNSSQTKNIDTKNFNSNSKESFIIRDINNNPNTGNTKNNLIIKQKKLIELKNRSPSNHNKNNINNINSNYYTKPYNKKPNKLNINKNSNNSNNLNSLNNISNLNTSTISTVSTKSHKLSNNNNLDKNKSNAITIKTIKPSKSNNNIFKQNQLNKIDLIKSQLINLSNLTSKSRSSNKNNDFAETYK